MLEVNATGDGRDTDKLSIDNAVFNSKVAEGMVDEDRLKERDSVLFAITVGDTEL